MVSDKKRLFVDIDGTLAEFKPVDTLETLYEEGYFLNLKPHMNVIDAVRHFVDNEPDVEVFILSSVLSDSKYALSEKNQWLDMFLPNIDMRHRIFPDCGRDKLEAAREYCISRNMMGDIDFQKSFLLDDYSKNLHSWDPPARGIKLMNGINGTNGTWSKARVFINTGSEQIIEGLKDVIGIDAQTQTMNFHRRGR